MHKIIAGGVALALIAFGHGSSASAQIADAPAGPPGDNPPMETATQPQSANAAASDDEPPATEAERVTVTAEKNPDYQLFRDLDAAQVCPIGFTRVALGFSCAEITYDVFDKNGKFLRRCNIPVFAVSEGRPFEYIAVTFRNFSCGNPKGKKRDLYEVELEHLLNPRTSDKTVFRKVSVLGYQQAKALCEASKELCVLDLFDHRDQLTARALKGDWIGGPPVPDWARDDPRENDDENEPYVSFGDELQSMFEREGER